MEIEASSALPLKNIRANYERNNKTTDKRIYVIDDGGETHLFKAKEIPAAKGMAYMLIDEKGQPKPNSVTVTTNQIRP